MYRHATETLFVKIFDKENCDRPLAGQNKLPSQIEDELKADKMKAKQRAHMVVTKLLNSTISIEEVCGVSHA